MAGNSNKFSKFLRELKHRKSVARKLASLYWRIMVKGMAFVEEGIKKYEERLLEQKHRSLQRLAKELNIQIPSNVLITESCH